MKSVLRLWVFFKKYRGSLITMMSFGGLMSLCQSAVAPLSGYLFSKVFSQSLGPSAEKLAPIDRFYTSLFGSEQTSLVWAVPLSLVVLYFFNGAFRYTHLFLMRYIGDQVAHDLRKALHSKYLRLNQTFHANYTAGSGGLLSRTLSDVQVIQNSTGQFAELVREPLLALLLLGYMLYMDWQLTVSILLAVPVLATCLKQLARSLRKYGYLHQETMETITSSIKETLDGVKVIQSYNLERQMEEQFESRTSRFLPNRRKIIAREEIFGPVSEVIGSIVFAALAIYFGLQTIEAGAASSGTFISFVMALGLIQQPVKKIPNAFIQTQQAVVSLERVVEILDDTREVPQVHQPKPFPSKWKEIEFRDTRFSYGSNTALQKINLKVRRGEIVAIVGASGSGKSTMINLLERFFDPSDGHVLIDGVDIREFDLKELRKNIALVTQDVFLFRDSVETNIAFGDLDKDRSLIASAAQSANASHFIEKLPDNYQSSAGERGSFFSGGEKQRISIARAIFKDAPILILDEATSALDSVSEIEVQKGLQKLMEGRTAFVIAHRLSTIKSADRILVMDQGRIVEEGTHEELVALKREYFQYFKHQSEN